MSMAEECNNFARRELIVYAGAKTATINSAIRKKHASAHMERALTEANPIKLFNI